MSKETEIVPHQPRKNTYSTGIITYLCVLNDGADPTAGSLDDLFQNREFIESLKFQGAVSQGFFNNPNVKRYTRFHLRSALKFMGCKNTDSVRIVDTTFNELEKIYVSRYGTPTTNSNGIGTIDPLSVIITKSQFFSIIRHSLTLHEYSKPYHMTDFPIACDVQDRKYSFTILLGGTSGCGKSTLAALLASRIGFSACLSTDNVRQIMRKFITREEAPILWASTYHAGEILADDPSLSHKDKILKGYEAQNEMIFKQLDVLISHYEARCESLIIEGVHLDTRLIMRLVKGHPTCIPFLMYISNEDKHRERFAIRSKYMTLDPKQNKYTKYFKNIRIINDYLCTGADVKMIPQIDNTNMDRSLATIHATIFNCLRRHVINNETYYNREKDNLEVVHEEFEAMKHRLWSSKGMLRVIRKKRGTPKQNKDKDKEKKDKDKKDKKDKDKDKDKDKVKEEEVAKEPGKEPEAPAGTLAQPVEEEESDDDEEDDGADDEESEEIAEIATVMPNNPQHQQEEPLGVFNSDDEGGDEEGTKTAENGALSPPTAQKKPVRGPLEEDENLSDFDEEWFMDCGSLGS